jgi:trans-4-hydroxy-L-proline dehydratase
MTERVRRLRSESFEAAPSISEERALLMTEFYQEHLGKLSIPMLRARAFLHLCEHKSIWMGEDELIVGERGPAPKAVPTYPELTCHSRQDLEILRNRENAPYAVSDEAMGAYEREVIPYWSGRSMRGCSGSTRRSSSPNVMRRSPKSVPRRPRILCAGRN